MHSVVKVTVASITDHCPFYQVGDTFLIRQQCFDPACASPRQFCFHSFTDIYETYREVRGGPIGATKSIGCMDQGKTMFELERLADEDGPGWH